MIILFAVYFVNCRSNMMILRWLQCGWLTPVNCWII